MSLPGCCLRAAISSPFDLSRRRRAAVDPDGLVGLIPYRSPIPLVAGVHTCSKHACIDLWCQAVVVRPRFHPGRSALRPLQLPIDRNLHPSDRLPYSDSSYVFFRDISGSALPATNIKRGLPIPSFFPGGLPFTRRDQTPQAVVDIKAPCA